MDHRLRTSVLDEYAGRDTSASGTRRTCGKTWRTVGRLAGGRRYWRAVFWAGPLQSMPARRALGTRTGRVAHFVGAPVRISRENGASVRSLWKRGLRVRALERVGHIRLRMGRRRRNLGRLGEKMAKMPHWGAFWRLAAAGRRGLAWASARVHLHVGHSAAARRSGDSGANGKK